MTEFSISKIINHRFHVDNEKCEWGIGGDMIIVRDLMIQLGLTADFKRQFLKWNGATESMEEPSSLLGHSFQLNARCVRWLCKLQNQLPHDRLLNNS